MRPGESPRALASRAQPATPGTPDRARDSVPLNRPVVYAIRGRRGASCKMLPMPILSVLDQSPIRSGGTPAQAIRETLELAEACDRLGYHRYWLAEHHGSG